MGFWLRLALLFAPREFRDHYGAQIALGAREMRASDVLDVALTGIRLRIEDVLRDLAYALRRLAKSPMFVAIVVFTFALGIGANVAVFSVLNAVVLRPLPYLDPSGLVTLGSRDTRRPSPPALSIVDVDDFRAQSRTLSSIAALAGDNITLLGNGRPVALGGLDVMPEYFAILGIHAQLGRVLAPSDSRPGLNNIVISDTVWRRDFAGDPGIINRSIALDGGSARVVGVLAPGQLLIDGRAAIEPQDYVAALPESEPPKERGSRYLGAVARLAPGVTVDEANAEIALISSRLQKLYPGEDKTFAFFVKALNVAVLGTAAPIVWTVFAAVIGILLIACANVGNMLGARWSARDREFALRRSLGATSWSVARLLVIETGVLACVGAIAGIALAYAGLTTFGRYALAALPRGETVGIDGATLLYALGIVIATTLLAALAPIVSLNVSDLNAMLKAAGRGGDSSGHHRARAALVVFEIAIALALVTISGLMVRGFIDLARTPLGIRPEGVVLSDIAALPDSRFKTLDARRALQARIVARLRALPGVDAAALTVSYPLGDASLSFDTQVLGKTYPQGETPDTAGNDVSSDYFKALGIPLLRGRVLNDGDTATSAPVVVVNQTFANTILAGLNPIGAKIQIDGWNGTIKHWATVVGVVGDTRSKLDAAVGPSYFVPITQAPPQFMSAVVHAPGVDTATVGREVQAAFAAELPTMEPPATHSVADRIAYWTQQVRLTTTLLATLSCVALLIALAGIFGVVSFSVTQRSREFGVRMALGAGTAAILGDVLRRAVVTTAIGVCAGVVIAALGARAVAAQIASVAAFDPMIFAGVIVLIFLAASMASLQPALRATHVQPVDALRYE